MRCIEENTVLAFAQARLAPDTLRDVEAHARSCATCRALLHGALEISGLVGTGATEPLGPTSVPRELPRFTLPKGTSIGRFTVLGLVGRGGMGEVYAAYDPGLDRRVALKLMHVEGAASDPRAQERLSREAQSIAKLSHPNVVVVYEVGMFDERMFIAMEFVEGVTLAGWLADRPRTWREILGVFLQAARGLSAAHRAGLVHRDFKPQNVMVARDGTARVMDFGLARRIGDVAVEDGATGATSTASGAGWAVLTLTRTGERLGTPMYMAPEQFAGRSTDARTDQFSFCVALFVALYGAPPFGGDTFAGLAKSVAVGQVAPPPAKSAAPTKLHRILARGLSVDPSARWPSMEALAAELAREPTRWRRAALVLAGVGVLSAAVGVAATRSVVSHRQVCEGGAARLAGVWELRSSGASGGAAGSRRAAVEGALLNSGGADAPKIWERVSSLLDKYATRWLGMYRETCEATRIRGEQSEEALDLRMACLGDNLDSARALTQLLSAGDPKVVERAVEATTALEDFSRCADVAQLRNGVQPPKDPMIRAKVAELRSKLNDAEALHEVGQVRDAARAASKVFQMAEGLAFCPLQAQALAVWGDSLVRFSWPEGVRILERAVLTGERCQADRAVARAATALVSPPDLVAAERWAAFADAAIDRIGDQRLRAWLFNNLGVLRFEQGRFEEGLTVSERATLMKEQLLGKNSPDVGISLTNVALFLDCLGRFQEALKYVDRAKQIATESRTLDWALEATYGRILMHLGRLEEASQSFVLALTQAGSGAEEDWSLKAEALTGQGTIALLRGDASGAISLLEEAARVRASSGDAEWLVAETRFTLAMALDRVHPGDKRALDLARQALATFEPLPSLARQRRQVQVWLESRPRRGAARLNPGPLVGRR